jgi:hypothetical protein
MRHALKLASVVAFLLASYAPAQTHSGTWANAARIRVCEVHIWGSAASAPKLQNTDDEPYSCYNAYGITWTITAVYCLADNSSTTTTVLPAVTGGSNILSGNLTCGNATFQSGTLNGTPTVASAGSINMEVVAGGTANSVRIVIVGRL